MESAAALVLAYLIGSLPNGYLITRFVAGSDIRSVGSGGTGATNVQRVLGWRWGLGIAIADVAKGVVVVLVARALGSSELITALAATIAVAGHCWPVWLGFRGGKGVATGGGAAFALSPWALFLIPIIVVPVAITRFVSLGSVTAAVAAPVIFGILAMLDVAPAEYVLYGLVAAAIILVKHRSNIQRLRTGTERRIGAVTQPATPA